MAGGTPTPAIPAAPGDEILVTITEPWRIAQWSGWDVPAEGEGANTWGPTILAERPRSFTVGVPTRHGDSVLTLELLLVTDDGRAVATIPASFLVRVD